MDFSDIIGTSASGMHSQARRLQIASENLANAETTGSTPGSDPYRRKIITFKEELDRITGASNVSVKKISHDKSDFRMHFDPNHPAANAQGYVKLPNVNPLIEIMDAHDAQHAYEANLNTMQITRAMLTRAINMMKS